MIRFKASATPRLATIVATSILAAGLTACSSSFQAAPGLVESGKNNGSTIGNTDTTPGYDAWKTLEVEGTADGGRFDAQQAVSLDKVNKELIVRLPMPANPFLNGSAVDFPVNGVSGVKLALESNADGSSALVLRVPLQKVLDGVKELPANRLPNGDVLPGVADGELPSVAVQLTQLRDIKASLYFGRTTVAIFVNTPFDPFIRWTVPVRNAAKTRIWGYLSAIPAKGDVEGGFYVNIALPDDIARVIDDAI